MAALMYAARAGAVSCSVISCRIRPASTAVEREREGERGGTRAAMGVAAILSMHVVLCDGASGVGLDVWIQGQGRCQGRGRRVVEFWCGER